MCVCVCYIQFAGYTDIVCSHVESNSVLVADDDTISAVSPARRGAHENIYVKCGTAGETSKSPLKCGCFGSAA